MFNSTFYLFYYYFLPFCVFRFQSTSDLNSAISFLSTSKPPWRNWLARSAVNRKVGGSSPPGGGPLFLFFKTLYFFIDDILHFCWTLAKQDEVAEWLRRWTANPMCAARVGSNPILVDIFGQPFD